MTTAITEQQSPEEIVKLPFQKYMDSTGLPIYRGHYVADLRLLELARWPEREVNGAFLELAGSEGITEGRVEELSPGQTLRVRNYIVDQLVYVVDGQGVTSVWTEGKPKKTFEWSKFSLFLLPGNVQHQITNMQGDKPARLLFYSYMPLAMSTVSNPSFVFDTPYSDPDRIYATDNPYAEATQQLGRSWGPGTSVSWFGNFFPNMLDWDKLNNSAGRGAGGASVSIRFPKSEVGAHMSVFPPSTYKKGHRHGPGRLIVIPGGDGYSMLWKQGEEKKIVPWHESSAFVPPDKWFHQHFNLGTTPARYLALHPPIQFVGRSESEEDKASDQIEYPQEDPMVREYFESELAKRGRKSLMPDEAYTNMDFSWKAAIKGAKEE